MKKIKHRIISLLIITTLILCSYVPITDTYAASAPVGKAVLYFLTADSEGEMLQYRNSGKDLKDGEAASFTLYTDEAYAEVFAGTYNECTYTSLNPDILEIETYFDESNMKKCVLHVRNTGNARIAVEIGSDEDNTYDPYTLYCDINVVYRGRKVRFVKDNLYQGETVTTAGAVRLSNGETDRSSFSFTMDETGCGIRLENYPAEYTSSDESVLSIDRQSGEVTLNGPGTAVVTATVAPDDNYGEEKFHCSLTVGKKYGIDMNTQVSVQSCNLSDGGVRIGIVPLQGVELSYSSSDTSIATVDAYGYVTFHSPGQVRIITESSETKYYQAGRFISWITISAPVTQSGALGYSFGGTGAPASQQLSQSSTLNTAALYVPSLSKPKLKCSKRSKRKNKLSWNKVANASGYELYVKYPGKKTYVRALTKDATVKSVTHKGLKRKKKYYYKLRAFVNVGGNIYYGPFSKAIKVKVK